MKFKLKVSHAACVCLSYKEKQKLCRFTYLMTSIEYFYIFLCHSDGLKAYTAPVGHVMHLSGTSGMPVYLNDSTYDGSTEQG